MGWIKPGAGKAAAYALGVLFCANLAYALAPAKAPSSEVLLSTGTTILDQKIAYPRTDKAHVTSAVITLPPGAETGWHRHEVPLYGYMLEGELTVTYEGVGDHVYKPGDAFMEAFETPHNGRNTGEGPVRILTVFMGADGVPGTVAMPGEGAAPAK